MQAPRPIQLPRSTAPLHPDILERPDAERIARRLRAVADPTRIQILSLIVSSPDGRRPVTELADELGLSQPTVSHHLRIMTDEGVLAREQDGRQAWYSIVPSRISDVIESVRVDSVVAAIAPGVLERISADLTSRFAGVFSPETVAGFVAESYTLLAERSSITRYLPSLTARFAADRLGALSLVGKPEGDDVPVVLFVCVQNAGRSQLAAAILRSLAGDRVRVFTAGSEPANAINSLVVSVLDEIGVPVGAEYPKPLTDEVVRAADVVITMGCGDACPVYPGRRYLDWDLADPASMTSGGIRELRRDIEQRVRELLIELDAD